MTTRSLEGKALLITGAGSGIGRGTALVAVEQGASLMLADLNRESAEETAEQVRAQGGKADALGVDVSSAEQVAEMVALTVERLGRLDCAFNNAGIDGTAAPLTDQTDADWDRVIDVDLKSVWLCMRAQIPHLLQHGGSIVNTSSICGLVGVEHGLSPYIAAKHGVVGLTKAAALEYATRGIRVNAICPGGIRTAMLDHVISTGVVTEQEASAMHPIGRLGRPDEVGETVAWLCSDRSSFITGHILAIDGGFVAR